MASDQSQLDQAIGAVVDPELGSPLGELQMAWVARFRRHRATVVVALPVAAWPAQDQLVEAVRAAASSVPGVDEVEVEVQVMDDQARAGLRRALRERMEGAPEDDGDGHDHDHSHGPGTPSFLRTGSSTRVIGVSSGKGGVGKSSV